MNDDNRGWFIGAAIGAVLAIAWYGTLAVLGVTANW